MVQQPKVIYIYSGCTNSLQGRGHNDFFLFHITSLRTVFLTNRYEEWLNMKLNNNKLKMWSQVFFLMRKMEEF